MRKKITVELQEMPVKTVVVLDHEALYAKLEQQSEWIAFACTYDQARAIDNWARRVKGTTVKHKAIFTGEGEAYLLKIHTGELGKPRGKKGA